MIMIESSHHPGKTAGKRNGAAFLRAVLFLVPLLCLAAGCVTYHPGVSPQQSGSDLFDVSDAYGSRDIPRHQNPVLGYIKKRFFDALDIFSFRVTLGPGVRAHARVTPYVQIGLGYMGPLESKGIGASVPLYKLGYLKREGGLWKEHTQEIGISTFYYYQTEGVPLGGNKVTFGIEDRRPWDVGAALHWLLVGAEAELRIDEAIDFVAGFFGVDIMKDDLPYKDPDILEPMGNG